MTFVFRIEIEKVAETTSVGVGGERTSIVSPQRQATSNSTGDECVSHMHAPRNIE